MNFSVFIVDDDDALRATIREALKAVFPSIHIVEAQDGAQALDIFDRMLAEKQLPSLVLIDVMLPKTSGFDCVQRMRTMMPQVPIVMMTGVMKQPQNATLAKTKFQTTAYLIKPFDMQQLVDIIEPFIAALNKTVPVQATRVPKYPMHEQGELIHSPLLYLLWRACQEGHTGILELFSERGERARFFVQGHLLSFAQCSGNEMHIGAELLRNGRIHNTQLEQVLSRARERTVGIYEILRYEVGISESAMRQNYQTLIPRIVEKTLPWSGQFRFIPTQAFQTIIPAVTLSLESTLLSVLKVMPGEVFWSHIEPRQMLKIRKNELFDQWKTVFHSVFGLDTIEKMLHGKASMNQILASAPYDGERMARLKQMYFLLNTQSVEVMNDTDVFTADFLHTREQAVAIEKNTVVSENSASISSIKSPTLSNATAKPIQDNVATSAPIPHHDQGVVPASVQRENNPPPDIKPPTIFTADPKPRATFESASVPTPKPAPIQTPTPVTSTTTPRSPSPSSIPAAIPTRSPSQSTSATPTKETSRLVMSVPRAPTPLAAASTDADQKVDTKWREIEKKTLYDVLGVARDAQVDVMKKNYLLLAREFHPDNMAGQLSPSHVRRADRLFALIQDAYATLTDATRKSEYDAQLYFTDKNMTSNIDEIMSAETQLERGRQMVDRGEFVSAARVISGAAAVLKDHEEAQTLALFCVWWQNREKSQLADLIKIIEDKQKAEPHSLYIKECLAWLSLESGDRAKAYKQFKEILSVESRHGGALRGIKALEIDVPKSKDRDSVTSSMSGWFKKS